MDVVSSAPALDFGERDCRRASENVAVTRHFSDERARTPGHTERNKAETKTEKPGNREMIQEQKGKKTTQKGKEMAQKRKEMENMKDR